MDFYKSKRISENITRITEITGVHMYLVEGRERALLIDTGCGLPGLRQHVKALTSLPLTVVCTHGHMDHAGGAAQFEEVYLHPEDVALSLTHCSVENRKEFVKLSVAVAHPEMDPLITEKWEYSQVRIEVYQELKDGMEFELGGMTVKALAFRGHTQGMMCMLFCQERSILFGDACNPSVFLYDIEASSVTEYKQSLEKFGKYEDLYDTVLLSHGPEQIFEKALRTQCVAVCDEILRGEDDKEDFIIMGGTYKAAHAILPNQMRRDGKVANIIYNPYRLYGGEE